MCMYENDIKAFNPTFFLYTASQCMYSLYVIHFKDSFFIYEDVMKKCASWWKTKTFKMKMT